MIWLLLYVILGAGTSSFLVGILRGESCVPMSIAAVALAVVTIREELPVARMARRRSIIRKLPAVETLGAGLLLQRFAARERQR